MAVLDIESVLGRPKNRVSRIGIELEGLWAKPPKGTRGIEVDRSVFKDPTLGRQVIPEGFNVANAGEIPSGAITPIFLSRFIKRCYPDKINATCGLHMHMSFEHPRYYSVLMDNQEYYDTVKDQMKKWATEEGFPKDHHIWDRIAGKSIFCQDIFWPDLQFAVERKDYDKQRKGHRYTIIHYCGRLKTIEIRALPMMGTEDKPDPAQAIRALRRMIDVTNACIFVLAKRREQKIVSKAIAVPGEVYTESFRSSIPLDPRIKLRVD